MDNLSCHYDVLGVRAGASLLEVKMAYRCLVKIWHPDRLIHDPVRQSQGMRRMQEINAAYSKLRAVVPKRPGTRPLDASWDDVYSIGISDIDGQHKIFFKMLHNFNDNYKSYFITTLDDRVITKIYIFVLNLRRYALKHFITEEEYMVKYRYPKYFEHRKSHDDFMKKILDIEEGYYKLNKLSPNNINDFVFSWLEEHIKGMDKDFGEYLKNVKRT